MVCIVPNDDERVGSTLTKFRARAAINIEVALLRGKGFFSALFALNGKDFAIPHPSEGM